MKSKPVVTLKANASGVFVSKNGKKETRNNFINGLKTFRDSLPKEKVGK